MSRRDDADLGIVYVLYQIADILEEEIMRQLESLRFNVNVGGNE